MKKIQILAATAATVFTASTVVSTTTQVARQLPVRKR